MQNTLKPEQNGGHCADDIFKSKNYIYKYIFFNENFDIYFTDVCSHGSNW